MDMSHCSYLHVVVFDGQSAAFSIFHLLLIVIGISRSKDAEKVAEWQVELDGLIVGFGVFIAVWLFVVIVYLLLGVVGVIEAITTTESPLRSSTLKLS